MQNSIYILSVSDIQVDKLHLCTWDVRNHPTSVEVGVSIANGDALPPHVEFCLVLPFLTPKCHITSLHETLGDSNNYKFIFNEIPASVNPVDGDKRNGTVVQLSGTTPELDRTHLIANAATAIDPALPTVVKVGFDRPTQPVGHLYVRLLIQTDADTIAEVIRGIAKHTYIFDVKVNEARNIPDAVLSYMRQHHLRIRPVHTAYCLHCVPSNYDIAFSDAAKLKNVRRLEKDAFQRYLPCLSGIGGEYVIVFIKHADPSGSYSFFTTFNREVVGNKQLLVAVVVSLCCNLLFAVASFRVVKAAGVEWYRQIPAEWWLAVCLIALGLLICLPIRKWGAKLVNWIRK